MSTYFVEQSLHGTLDSALWECWRFACLNPQVSADEATGTYLVEVVHRIH